MSRASLGNLRCYEGATCIDQDRGGYAAFATWEEGFLAWYKLIKNSYVGQRGLTTIEHVTHSPSLKGRGFFHSSVVGCSSMRLVETTH